MGLGLCFTGGWRYSSAELEGGDTGYERYSSAELEGGDTGYNYEGGDKGYTQVKSGD